jgi:hypothetical protein
MNNSTKRLTLRRSQLLALVVLLLANGAIPAKPLSITDVAQHISGIWAIDSAEHLQRWIVIHNPNATDNKAILHIEVLGKAPKAAAWTVKRLAPHMAVTWDVILQSVRKPLNQGLVYPEQYENARSRWEKESKEGHAKLCTTTLDRCLNNDW